MKNVGMFTAFVAIGVAVSVVTGSWVWVGAFMAIGIAFGLATKR